MIYAHRGLTMGPNKELENTLETLELCKYFGIEGVELDICQRYCQHNHKLWTRTAPTAERILRAVKDYGLKCNLEIKDYVSSEKILRVLKELEIDPKDLDIVSKMPEVLVNLKMQDCPYKLGAVIEVGGHPSRFDKYDFLSVALEVWAEMNAIERKSVKYLWNTNSIEQLLPIQIYGPKVNLIVDQSYKIKNELSS